VAPVAAQSTWKKSHASIVAACERNHCRHVVRAAAAAVGGVLAALTVRNGPRPASGTASPDPHTVECLHCALDAPPLRSGDQEAELDPGTPQ
jgi:hypothetical protein